MDIAGSVRCLLRIVLPAFPVELAMRLPVASQLSLSIPCRQVINVRPTSTRVPNFPTSQEMCYSITIPIF
eukprot:2160500-Amphidinium_carterae.1